MERKGKVIPCRWTGDRKDAGTKSGESGARNLEEHHPRNKIKETADTHFMPAVTLYNIFYDRVPQTVTDETKKSK